MSQEYEIKTYGTAKVVLEAGEYTVKDLIGIIGGMGQLNRHNRALIDAVTLSSNPSGLRQRKAQPEQCQCPNCKVTLHASDCAVHNEPAYPKGQCNCGAQPYPENFIDALTYDVARRDFESAQQEPVATDWERIARVQDAKLRAMCNEAGGFEKLCEVMDKYEQTSPPQRQWVGLTDEEQIAEALRVHGLTLVKTASGYEVLKLGQITAHNIKEQP